MPDLEQHRAELSRQYLTALFAGLHDVADVLRAELDRLERRNGPGMSGPSTPEGETSGD